MPLQSCSSFSTGDSGAGGRDQASLAGHRSVWAGPVTAFMSPLSGAGQGPGRLPDAPMVGLERADEGGRSREGRGQGVGRERALRGV